MLFIWARRPCRLFESTYLRPKARCRVRCGAYNKNKIKRKQNPPDSRTTDGDDRRGDQRPRSWTILFVVVTLGGIADDTGFGTGSLTRRLLGSRSRGRSLRQKE